MLDSYWLTASVCTWGLKWSTRSNLADFSSDNSCLKNVKMYTDNCFTPHQSCSWNIHLILNRKKHSTILITLQLNNILPYHFSASTHDWCIAAYFQCIFRNCKDCDCNITLLTPVMMLMMTDRMYRKLNIENSGQYWAQHKTQFIWQFMGNLWLLQHICITI